MVKDRGDLFQIAAPDTSSNAAKEENFMRALIQSTPAYQLSADITPTAHGHNFRFISFVPTARRPEEQVKFQATFSRAELASLRDLIDDVLSVHPSTPTAGGLASSAIPEVTGNSGPVR